MPEIWGLTGGIASGKSTAAKAFAAAGVPFVDADEIARELRAPDGAAHALIVARFGTADPVKLRQVVFTDPRAKNDLEGILHPLIQKESLARIRSFKAKRVIYEASLLIETGRYQDFAGLIVIVSPLEARRQRLVARDRISLELADQMIASQISDEERRKVATHVIENDGSAENLTKKIQSFVQIHSW